MPNLSYQGKFIDQAESFIIENISNEQFGVSELANLMNMSRSNLLRKIKKQTELSASQFIRHSSSTKKPVQIYAKFHYESGL